METALYYTLSTIAQTLAGALAVMVAFVLLRLKDLEDNVGSGQAVLVSKSGTVPFAESWPLGVIRTAGPGLSRGHDTLGVYSA
jgi:hypothetical protein